MSGKDLKVVELDVRPYLRKKLEPFQVIMDTVKKLEEDSLFVLHATFKPTPLYGVLRTKGLVSKTEKMAKDHWIITFVNKKNKHLLKDIKGSEEKEHLVRKKTTTSTEPRESKSIQLDNRGLEPPQPMIRTLSALDRSLPGDVVYIHNDRVPVFLIEELNNLGYPFEVDEQPDGSAKVKILKK